MTESKAYIAIDAHAHSCVLGWRNGHGQYQHAVRFSTGEHDLLKHIRTVTSCDPDFVGIYFSAAWCGPCRMFTPQLIAAYRQLRSENKPFEVVFVSRDHDEPSMMEYMRSHDMPWLAMPFGDKRIDELVTKYQAYGIPRLVVVDSGGKTLSDDARNDIARNGAQAFDGW